MSIITHFEEKDVAFLQVPKCIRQVVGRDAAELYALLREKRRYLVSKQLIRDYGGWFYYSTKDMQEDLLPPNSVNYVKGLLIKLQEASLIEVKFIGDPQVKHFRINEQQYLQTAERMERERVRHLQQKYDDMRKVEEEKNNFY